MEDGVTTLYVGAHYQVSGSVVTKYYFAGTQMIAMRTNGVLNYMLADHLGSTSLVTDAAGTVIAETRYTPYGETRFASGTSPTDYLYTSQRQEAGLGLYFYNARWYDPALARFNQPDILIPKAGNPQAFDRYAYGLNNPVRYSDPSGHWVETALDIAFIGYDVYDIATNGLNWENGLSLAADVVCAIVPVVAGGGLIVRAAMHADDAVKTVKTIDKVVDTAKALDKTVETVKTVEKSIDAANLGDGLAQSVKALNNVLQPGQSGAFNTLKPVVGDGLTPHHMPQAARKFTSVVEGGALVIQGIEHKLTRTYGGKGVKTLINEATLSFRSTLARDIWDIKKLTGTKYNFGLNNLLKYYRKYFPGLIKK